MIKRNTRNVFTYKDEYKHSKQVSNKHFLVDEKEFPLNPLSQKYLRYWKQQKRRMIEGYWHDGKWMPGSLYFYVNFTKISLSKDGSAKGKIIAKPFLRDLEWEKHYVYMEAKGFSGFSDDEEYTCWRDMQIPSDQRLFSTPKNCYKKDGTEKKYIDARDYLRIVHSKNLGKPLFDNDAQNVIDLESRGNGKSYDAAGKISHNFLTDGATDYDEYLAGLRGDADRLKTETLVGAIDAKYSTDLLEKTETAIENLAGSVTFQGREYRSPLHKAYSGSLYSGKKLIQAKVDVKVGNEWFKRGSGSMIHHKTFKDNPLAAAGTRNSFAVLEEGMFMNNLKESLGAMKDTTYNGPRKFGVIYIMGTGGGAENGRTDAAMDVFFHPTAYDCLAFDDIWEEAGEIGFFVPYKYGLNDFKDSEGVTIDSKADKYIVTKREGLKRGNDKTALNTELQNHPNAPSEAFLMSGNSVLPVSDIKEQLGWVKSKIQTDDVVKGELGEIVLVQSESGGETVAWRPDINGTMFSCGYKMERSSNTDGAIRIWEHPQHIAEDGSIPYGLYIAGTDPYDQDQSSTASLGSTFIYKRFHHSEGHYDWPVAEYTARPATADQHHETVRRLLLYYNATCLYENERNSMKAYFQHNHSLHLLARQPDILKATERTTVDRTYGIHMTDGIKDEIEIYLRDWLLADAGGGKKNLHKIYSIPLLEELMYYNRDGNLDRFISIALTILHLLQKKQIKVDEVKKENLLINDPFFKRNFAGVGSRTNEEGKVMAGVGQASFGSLFN